MKVYLISLFFLFILPVFPQNEKSTLVEKEFHQWQNSFNSSAVYYPGDQSIDIRYYKLNLEIFHEEELLKGIVTVAAVPVLGSISGFYLDLKNNMKVDSVKLNDKKILFTRRADSLKISLDKNYTQNEKFSVDIYYHGTPIRSANSFPSFTFGTTGNDNPAIYTLSQPYGSKDWWPCKDTPGDKADSADIWITCDENLYAVSNGSLLEIVTNSNGNKTYKWKSSYPIAQYLISLAISNYRIYTAYFKYSTTDSMPVIHYIYPEVFNEYKSILDETINMLAVFSDKFGLYPFIREKYGHAQFGWGGGMEHQTVSSMGGFNRDLISHELAHQWFGDKITCRDWHNIWLNEGFATYLEAIYLEAMGGKQGYNNAISIEMGNAKNAKRPVYAENISSSGAIFDYSATYAKGSIILHMLRGVVGDDIFFQIMREYLQDSTVAYGTAVTADFQKHAEQVYGHSLKYFFSEWVYMTGFPDYEAIWSSQESGNNMYNLSLVINQKQSNLFKMPIEILVNTAAGDTSLTIFNDQHSQTYNILVSGKPTGIIIDPDDWILKDVSVITSLEENNSVSGFSLKQNYPNPFNPSTSISFTVPGFQSSMVPVMLKVYDVIGNLIAVLIDKEMASGEYEIYFDASARGLTSGVYLYELEAGDFSETRKMVLMK